MTGWILAAPSARIGRRAYGRGVSRASSGLPVHC